MFQRGLFKFSVQEILYLYVREEEMYLFILLYLYFYYIIIFKHIFSFFFSGHFGNFCILLRKNIVWAALFLSTFFLPRDSSDHTFIQQLLSMLCVSSLEEPSIMACFTSFAMYHVLDELFQFFRMISGCRAIRRCCFSCQLYITQRIPLLKSVKPTLADTKFWISYYIFDYQFPW